VYKGVELKAAYRADRIVEGNVVVEVKSVESLAPVHQAQLISYLRLAACPAGLLITST
jgi:GxxExxY protein